VQVEFDGIDQQDGLIAEAVDEHTGQLDEVATINNLLTIRGYGLKIKADDIHKDKVGLFFDDGESALVKVDILAVNESRTLKAIVPASLAVGKSYALKVITQSPARGKGSLLKNIHEIRSGFKLTAKT
jgi:hypothetical protein